MFYMPKYHNLPDGRQIFLRFPDPERHALPANRLLKAVSDEEQAKVFLAEANADPQRLVLIAEVAGAVAGCGLLELQDQPQLQVEIDQAYSGIGLENLVETSLKEVAAQKGVEL